MEDGADEKAAWRTSHRGVAEEGSATSHLSVLENPVLKVLEAVADAVTPAEVHEALVDRIGQALGASSVGLWLVDAEGDTTTLVRSRGYAAEAEQAMRHLNVNLDPGMPVLDCIRSGEPLWIPSQTAMYERYPHLRRLATDGRSYRVSCLPLVAHDRVLGSLSLTIESAGQASLPEQEFLLLVARYATQAIERLRLYQDSLEARLRAEHLYRFAQAVVAADRIEVVYEAALDCIHAALGVPRAAILVLDEGKVMRFRAWRGLSDSYRSAVEGHSPWPADAVAPEPVVLGDPSTKPAWAAFAETFRRERIGALAFIPLATRGRLVGKLMLYADRPHGLSAHSLDTARLIANHLASAMARFAAVGKLEETIRYNELVAGALAHDLRSPLTAIMSGAGALATAATRDPERTQIGAARIIESADLMSRMIEALLDFTRVRVGGGIALDRQPADLARLCAAVVGELELAHPSWTIAHEVRGDVTGSWDSDRLHQVLSNLILNAGHHGDSGAPIRIELDGERSDEVSVQVRNKGTVPAAILPHVFDPFRTTQEQTGAGSGIGLGLFIVREVVRAHGGTVEIESSPDIGTSVSVRLPR